MNTHRLDVSDFEHTQPGVTHCWPEPEVDAPVRPRWVPLILTLIGSGVAGMYWIHSLYSA